MSGRFSEDGYYIPDKSPYEIEHGHSAFDEVEEYKGQRGIVGEKSDNKEQTPLSYGNR